MLQSVALLREENITGSVNSLRVLERDVLEMSNFGCRKILTPLRFTGKNEPTNAFLKKIGIHLTDTPVVSIMIFLRAVIKQFIN